MFWFFTIMYGATAEYLGPQTPYINESWPENLKEEAWNNSYGNATWIDPITEELGIV